MLFRFTLFLIFPLAVSAQTVTPLIRIDQFGYRPNQQKIAVISDPQTGFNANESFTPGTLYQVRKEFTNEVVWTGIPEAWKNGATHTQSGDKGWWIDFSSFHSTGTFHLLDVQKNVRSYPFRIAESAYKDALREACRMFYYQRIGFAKNTPYANSKWTDGASYLGPEQDTEARSRWAKNDPSTARDVRGGWMDAGDENKYTTFAEGVILQLMQAYRYKPDVFTDHFNIPESNNGISDLLDEVKWELDYFIRTQDATGTDGLLLKVGVDNYNSVSPPSADTRKRYYLPECTSATLSGAAMFASAGLVYRNEMYEDLQNYGEELIDRAKKAWARAKVTTNNFTTFETNCDDGDIKSGDADRSEDAQLESAVIAAVYLYAATGAAEYKTFVETQYSLIEPVKNSWWGPYKTNVEEALLFYSGQQGVSIAVSEHIRSQKKNMDYLFSINDLNSQTDLYRAYMEDWAHHWGSNFVRANCGTMNLDFIAHDINPDKAGQYYNAAEQYLHWLHGCNPLGMMMLSNMYSFGGDFCPNEIYHTWFADGTIYDNALTSPNGPPPGYVTGGPNKDFSVPQISPPGNQPPQKSYKDFNTGWPENSWEISEPAIYYQAAYILLLSRLMPDGSVDANELQEPVWTMQVLPNPVKDEIVIQASFPQSQQVRVEIFDSKGGLVKSITENGVEGTNVFRYQAVNLPAGSYFLRMSDQSGERSVVIVK